MFNNPKAVNYSDFFFFAFFPLPLNGLAERTEVLYGTEKVISEELQFFSKTKRQIDTCMDHTRPLLAIAIESIKRSFVDAKSRDVKLRYLSEITDANIS